MPKPSRVLYALPIAVAGVGVVVHGLGLLGVDPEGAPQAAHVVMLGVDTSVFVGLLRRRTWGYWLAVVLFARQTIFQIYWAHAAAAAETRLWQAQLLTPVVCLSCLLVLVVRKEWYQIGDAGRSSAA